MKSRFVKKNQICDITINLMSEKNSGWVICGHQCQITNESYLLLRILFDRRAQQKSIEHVFSVYFVLGCQKMLGMRNQFYVEYSKI